MHQENNARKAAFDALVITVSSPNGEIKARVSGRADLRVDFRPQTYGRYDDGDLSRQLSRLAVTGWVTWTREHRELRRRLDHLTREEAQARRPAEDSAYDAALRTVECQGRSPEQAILIRTSGMTDWQVDIAEGTVRYYSEHRFLDELHAAFAALLQDRADQVILLKAEHLDIGLPRRLLALQQRILNSGGHRENR